MLSYINDFPMEFRDYIASEIIPQYADFDKAHRVDHVLKVIAESLKLSQYYDVNRMMVMLLPPTMIWDSVRDESSIISFQGKYYGRTRN